MKKKTYELVVGVTGGVATIASAVVAFLQPAAHLLYISPVRRGCFFLEFRK